MKPARPDSPRELWRKAEAKARRDGLEERLAQQISAVHLPRPEREFAFHPTRAWRIDFAWPLFRVLVEVEGITQAGGRHQRPAGFEADAEKYAEAQRMGFTVLRISPGMVKSGWGVRIITDVLERVSREMGTRT